MDQRSTRRTIDLTQIGVRSSGSFSGQDRSAVVDPARIEALDPTPKLVVLSNDVLIVYLTENGGQPLSDPRIIRAWFLDAQRMTILRAQTWTARAKQFSNSEGQLIDVRDGCFVIMADRKLLLYRGSQLLAKRLLSPGDWYMVLLRHALPGGRTDYLWLDSQTLEQTGSPIADRDSYRHLTLLGGGMEVASSPGRAAD